MIFIVYLMFKKIYSSHLRRLTFFFFVKKNETKMKKFRDRLTRSHSNRWKMKQGTCLEGDNKRNWCVRNIVAFTFNPLKIFHCLKILESFKYQSERVYLSRGTTRRYTCEVTKWEYFIGFFYFIYRLRNIK